MCIRDRGLGALLYMLVTSHHPFYYQLDPTKFRQRNDFRLCREFLERISKGYPDLSDWIRNKELEQAIYDLLEPLAANRKFRAEGINISHPDSLHPREFPKLKDFQEKHKNKGVIVQDLLFCTLVGVPYDKYYLDQILEMKELKMGEFRVVQDCLKRKRDTYLAIIQTLSNLEKLFKVEAPTAMLASLADYKRDNYVLLNMVLTLVALSRSNKLYKMITKFSEFSKEEFESYWNEEFAIDQLKQYQGTPYLSCLEPFAKLVSDDYFKIKTVFRKLSEEFLIGVSQGLYEGFSREVDEILATAMKLGHHHIDVCYYNGVKCLQPHQYESLEGQKRVVIQEFLKEQMLQMLRLIREPDAAGILLVQTSWDLINIMYTDEFNDLSINLGYYSLASQKMNPITEKDFFAQRNFLFKYLTDCLSTVGAKEHQKAIELLR
eukprot:TRINITY_DN12700_c0_g1_i3.p1 TRINITY_DN12700_c0_g1~~TRINITY_DN12700_c0_g1_i3.p1  ORF type:complete len:434 (+),score=65.16 TRINITY_DN12700_c0_g1_i3:64-1365(+)